MITAAPLLSLASLVVLPAGAEEMNDARLLIEAQVQVAAAAILVMEQEGISPSQRAARLFPLAEELERLHARRAQLNAQQLEQEERLAAANAGVRKIALRLLRDMEHCAAAGYAGSAELESAVRRLALAFEGEKAEPEQETPAATGQSGAAPAH